MKTLDELRAVLCKDIPCPFASEADAVSDFPYSVSDDETNFVTGIVGKYAQATGDGGELMPRGDFNRIGEIATRELFFRQSGAIHSFDSAYTAANGGYAEGALLLRDDGKYLLPVESTESDNDLDFTQSPSPVGTLANKPTDPADAPPRVLWKPAASGHGLGFGGIDFSVDFSRRHDLSQGETLSADSLVSIGFCCYGVGNVWRETEGTAGPVRMFFTVGDDPKTQDMYMTYKGAQGVKGGGLGLILPWGPFYWARFFGVGNDQLCFFARKGDKIGWKLEMFGKDPGDGQSQFVVCAFPISIRKPESEVAS